MKQIKWLFVLAVFATIFTGCTPSVAPTIKLEAPTNLPAPSEVPAEPVPATDGPSANAPLASGELILATTTSTRDSGLLDVLLPIFEAQSGIKVKMVAVGTGAALKMGEEGNADVLLVHAPKSEMDLMNNGFGKDRLLVMHNDFVIVGPASDPAGIKGMATAKEAFAKVAALKATFVTRGDDSGTNKAELTIWKSAEISPESKWYVSTGQGMGDTLRVASEKDGYTLTDRATYLALKDTLSLDILVEGERALLNIYHVITINPEKWPLVNYDGALAFANFLVSAETQTKIGEFGVSEYDQPLFISDAGKAEDTLGK